MGGRPVIPRRSAVLAARSAFCAGTLTLVGGTSAVANSHALGPHWRVVARTPGSLGTVIAPTATSAWAFGWGAHPPSGPIFPIGRHWNGRRWSRVQFPSGVKNSGMSCARGSSPTNLWAFSGAGASGGNPPSTVSALRLRAGHWVVVKDFAGSYVTGCNVLGTTNVWVFGGEVAGLGPAIGTWHLRGSRWTQIKTGNLVLFNASAVSATDIWAAGADISHGPRNQPVVARWDGSSWHEITSIGAALPRPSSTTFVGLDSINAMSARNVWVLASVFRRPALSFLVVHWNGHTWSRVRPGSPGYYLPTAVRDGHGGWWSPPYLPGLPVRYLLHRAHGRWIRFALPARLLFFPGSVTPFLSITHVPHTNAMLLAGTQIQPSGTAGVILAFGRLPA